MNHTTLAIVAVIAIAALLVGAIAISTSPTTTAYAWKNKKKSNDNDDNNKNIDTITKESGVESSLDENDIKGYFNRVVEEINVRKRSPKSKIWRNYCIINI